MTLDRDKDLTPIDEADRIREAYARRARTGADERYSLDDPANRFLFERRERAIIEILGAHDLLPLAGKRILDVGCGNGAVLADFVRLGAEPNNSAGIDLLEERMASAQEELPIADIRSGSAEALPWQDDSFDLALQFTLISSVLDHSARRRIAAETMRILRPGGALLYYDFIWNPANRDTRGLRLADLHSLYPGCTVDARRTTLAPPVTRVLARWSLAACRALEALPFLRSHYLALITRPAK